MRLSLHIRLLILPALVSALFVAPKSRIHPPAATSSLAPPPHPQDPRIPQCGVLVLVGITTMAFLAPLPAVAVVDHPPAINIQVDIKGMRQFIVENRNEFLRLGKGILSNVRISKSTTNLLDATSQALQGDILLNINDDIPIDISVLSETGGLDVAVVSDQGDISLTIASQYLPKLPLLNKENHVATISPEALGEYRAARLEMAKRGAPVSFWEETSIVGRMFRQPWTNAQVIGSTAFTIGYAYLASKTVYDYETQKAERQAALAREALEETKRVAAAARAKVEAERQAKNEAIRKRMEKLKAEKLAAASKTTMDASRYLESVEYSPTVVPQKPAVVPQVGQVYVSPRMVEQQVSILRKRRRRRLVERIHKETAAQEEASARQQRVQHAIQESIWNQFPGITTDEYVRMLEYSPTVVPQAKPFVLEQTDDVSLLSSPRTIARTPQKRRTWRLFQRRR